MKSVQVLLALFASIFGGGVKEVRRSRQIRHETIDDSQRKAWQKQRSQIIESANVEINRYKKPGGRGPEQGQVPESAAGPAEGESGPGAEGLPVLQEQAGRGQKDFGGSEEEGQPGAFGGPEKECPPAAGALSG